MAEREALLRRTCATARYPHGGVGIPMAPTQARLPAGAKRRAGSPPRGHFQAVNTRLRLPMGASRSNGAPTACSARCVTTGGIQLTMDSLKMGGGPRARPR